MDEPGCAPPQRAPYRVVDADGDPWMCRDPYGAEEEALVSGRPWKPGDPPRTVDQVVFENNHTRSVLAYATLTERHGPVRPVVAMPPADAERLQELARAAGRKTLGTIAAALYAVEMRLGAEPPQLAHPGGLVHRDRLTAGRPGSWEAAILIDVIWVVGPTVTGDRIYPPLMDAATEIFARWATSPDGYVEFAETIPVVLAPVIDNYVTTRTLGIADDYLLDNEQLMNWAGSLSRVAGNRSRGFWA